MHTETNVALAEVERGGRQRIPPKLPQQLPTRHEKKSIATKFPLPERSAGRMNSHQLLGLDEARLGVHAVILICQLAESRYVVRLLLELGCAAHTSHAPVASAIQKRAAREKRPATRMHAEARSW